MTPHKPYLFVVSGKMGAGKDTVAAIVAQKLGGPFEQVSFAAPLKDQLDEVIDAIRNDEDLSQIVLEHQVQPLLDILTPGVLEDRKAHARSRQPYIRSGLQYLGKNTRDSRGENWWADQAFDRCELLLERGISVYITDGRYRNELALARTRGAVTVRLEVPEEIRVARIVARDGRTPERAELDHESETDVTVANTAFDIVIYDDGTDAIDVVADQIADQIVRQVSGTGMAH